MSQQVSDTWEPAPTVFGCTLAQIRQLITNYETATGHGDDVTRADLKFIASALPAAFAKLTDAEWDDMVSGVRTFDATIAASADYRGIRVALTLSCVADEAE